MAFSDSTLATYTHILPYHYGGRTKAITRITPHCWAGHGVLAGFQSTALDRHISANYAIDDGGRIGLFVHEADAAWTSSSADNDHRAVTIECASDAYGACRMYDATYEALVRLCADICRRNGKTRLLWLGTKEATLAYTPAETEMVLTAHRWFANKSCPGDWLYGRFGTLATEVTTLLGGGSVTFEAPDGAYALADNEQHDVGIESVNGGKNWIEDTDAVAVYGRIWRVQRFDTLERPAEIKAAGEAYLAANGGIRDRFEAQAVDLHLADGTVPALLAGKKYPVSCPGIGAAGTYICTKASVDLLDPTAGSYVLGRNVKGLTRYFGAAARQDARLVASAGAGTATERTLQLLDSDIIDANAEIEKLKERVSRLEPADPAPEAGEGG